MFGGGFPRRVTPRASPSRALGCSCFGVTAVDCEVTAAHFALWAGVLFLGLGADLLCFWGVEGGVTVRSLQIGPCSQRESGEDLETMQRRGKWPFDAALGVVCLFLFSCVLFGCDKAESEAGPPAGAEVTVLRAESSSPEEPAGEYCAPGGKDCVPLAPRQKLKPEGIVRTFVGGRVSLDFGAGRRVDLDAQSETVLQKEWVQLARGQFSLESAPWNQDEKFKPLHFQAGGKKVSSLSDLATSTSVSVDAKDTIITVQRGALSGLDVPGWEGPAAQAGQSVRISDAQIHRTGEGGQELPLLLEVAPRTSEFGGLLAREERGPLRGLGTMSARLPNTDQVRDGVHLRKHHVNVFIRDGFARTEIEEEFENTTPHVLEGRYRFAVPGDASLSRLALWVGDKLIEGEVLERERAATIYSSIVDRPVPRDPALLEWVSGGEMSLKVFPILPKKTRRLVLAYNQALSTEQGLLRYVYPLSLGGGRETVISDLSISVSLSDSHAQLTNLRSPNYDAAIGEKNGYQTVSFQKKEAAPSQDFILLADRKTDAKAQIAAYVPEWGEAKAAPSGMIPASALSEHSGALGTFALRFSADLPSEGARPAGLPQQRAIVLDVSQSQSEETIRAQGALAYGILRSMNPEEQYVLLACDSACRRFPSGGAAVVREGGLLKARDFLLSLRPSGSSDLSGALAMATRELRPFVGHQGVERQVILLSDGQASSGEISAEGIARRTGPLLAAVDADLSIIGAGRVVDEDTLSGLARSLGATFDLLHSGKSLEERIFELSYALRLPVIKNPVLSLPDSLRSEEALKLPALRLGQELIVTGEILRLGEGEVTLSGQMKGAPYRLVRSLAWQKGAEGQNPLVPRLWARNKISRLLASEQTPSIKDEIVKLSREHRTMSPYTSFLVLESEEMYRDFAVTRTSQSEKDQPDALFKELGDTRARAQPSDDGELSRMTSLEELADRPGAGRSAPAAEARPEAAPAPRPAKKSASSGAKKAESGPLDFELGASASTGSAQVSGAEAEESKGRGWSEPVQGQSKIITFSPPVAPRARLTFSSVNDEWRKWGEKNIEALKAKLKEDPQSRARHEAYIRGHLQHGRFEEARRDAQ